jgi:RNA polymerase sigma factor (sigma-70 family)
MDAATPLDLSSAIELLVDRFARMVRAVGARHALPESDLDEVLQEVRIRLWHAHARGEDLAALPTSYIYRTATTAALDVLRGRRRHGGRSVDYRDAEAGALESAETADRRTDEDDAVRQLSRALDALPTDRRVVVRMHLAGYDREEIAAMLGWGDGRIRNLLYRGLAQLRGHLDAATQEGR